MRPGYRHIIGNVVVCGVRHGIGQRGSVEARIVPIMYLRCCPTAQQSGDNTGDQAQYKKFPAGRTQAFSWGTVQAHKKCSGYPEQKCFGQLEAESIPKTTDAQHGTIPVERGEEKGGNARDEE